MPRKILALLQPELANALKKRMEDSDLSSVQLAKDLSLQEGCRVSQSTVSAILNCSNGCSVERLSSIENIIRIYEKAKEAKEKAMAKAKNRVSNKVLVNG